MPILNITDQQFRPRLLLGDYALDRDGFCLWVTDTKRGKGYQILMGQLTNLIVDFGMLATHATIEAILVGENDLVRHFFPDEKIIQYCIDHALIPHPYEEYV